MAKASKGKTRRAKDEGEPVPGLTPKRRTLAAFRPLLAAEEQLLACCRAGCPATISEAVPDKGPGVRIRGDFVRFLALGGDEAAPAHEAGLAIEGAYIEDRLDLAGCHVKGALRFSRCRFEEEVWADSSTILSLSFDGSHLPGLTLESAEILSSLYLSSGFRSTGQVRLVGAQIGGNLECDEGSFEHDGIALHGQCMNVARAFMLRDVKAVSGDFMLVAAHVGTLADQLASWQKAKNVVLDGFTYDRIDSLDIAASKRLAWLRLQNPMQYGEVFWPQPWEQLAKVLREMGHVEDAKQIGIGKQLEVRKLGLVGQRPLLGVSWLQKTVNRTLNALHRFLHRTYGVLAGFGYRPLKTVGWMVMVWLICGAAFMMAARSGLIAPTNASLYTNQDLQQCGFGNEGLGVAWTECARLPPEYSPFDPFVYSLDVILPLLDLKQENEWRPVVHDAHGNELSFGHALRFLMWFEILFGWITSLLLVSALGKLVQKD